MQHAVMLDCVSKTINNQGGFGLAKVLKLALLLTVHHWAVGCQEALS